MATATYKAVGKRVINGKKKVLYKKAKSQKVYCKCKGRMMNVIKYIKMNSRTAH